MSRRLGAGWCWCWWFERADRVEPSEERQNSFQLFDYVRIQIRTPG